MYFSQTNQTAGLIKRMATLGLVCATTATLITGCLENSVGSSAENASSVAGVTPSSLTSGRTSILVATPSVNTSPNPQISAGYWHNTLLKSDGTVWTWGGNEWGQLGNGTSSASAITSTPTQVAGLTGMIAVASGFYDSFALKSDGTLWAWGRNWIGQLGNGTAADSFTPTQVYITDVKAVAAGLFHTVAVKNDGTVWAWGYNRTAWDYPTGQLGSSSPVSTALPLQVPGLTGITAISAGAYHNLALDSSGNVWAWGLGYYGEIGNGSNNNPTAPVKVLTGGSSIAAGFYHSVAIKSDGTVWTWGYNGDGQLGNGSTANFNVPVQVAGLSAVTSISANFFHTMAVKSDGTAWGWGANYVGWLGDGTSTAHTTPVQVSGLTNVTSLSAGLYHSSAMKSDGTVWVWGWNNHGLYGTGSTSCCSSAPMQSAVDGGYATPPAVPSGT